MSLKVYRKLQHLVHIIKLVPRKAAQPDIEDIRTASSLLPFKTIPSSIYDLKVHS